jgi:HAD superfamily hydrolase (TIGR01509 family)
MSELPRPLGIALDCDGLLVDTEKLWTIAESEVFGRRGWDYTEELKAHFLGTSLDWTVARMAELFDEPGNEAQLREEVMVRVAEVIGAQAEPMPGALALVASLEGKVPMMVVSNSDRILVELALGRTGMRDAVEGIVAGDEVVRGKPAPDLYLKGSELLGLAPADMLAFEDSLVGVQAAQAAGVPVVGVPTMEQDGFAPDFLFASLADPVLQAWAAAL